MAVRPFLNWAVALFFFLSGMLTGRRQTLTGEVLCGRIVRVLGPYVVWSLIYLVASRPSGAWEVVVALLTGGAAAHLYYLLVYIQLTALAPLLLRLLRSHRAALYLVTPCVLVAWELRALCGVDVPSIAVLFPAWLVYYLFGLEWGRWRSKLRGREGGVAAVACVALALQVGEGFYWDALGDYDMATTQLRLTNVASSLAVIALLMLAPERARERLARCGALVHLGDLSFGVYLCHVALIMVLRKALGLVGLADVPLIFALWAFALGLSVLLANAGRRVLPHRVRALVLGTES